MKRTMRIAVVTLALATILAATPQKTGIRKVDFKNFVYVWDRPIEGVPSRWRWIRTRASARFRLVQGKHRFFDARASRSERESSSGVWFSSVAYGDLDGDGTDEAAVAMNYSTGGTANWEYLYVYKLVAGKPKLLARLESGSRADGGLGEVSIQNGLLILEFSDTARRVADCCSEGFVRVRYQWREKRFVEIAPRERGNVKLQVR